MPASAHRPRPSVYPAVGPPEVRLAMAPITPCELLPAGLGGLVLINDRLYRLSIHATLPARGQQQLHGYRLTADDGSAYDLPADLSSCDCADGCFRQRPGGCKHAAALRQLVRQGLVP